MNAEITVRVSQKNASHSRVVITWLQDGQVVATKGYTQKNTSGKPLDQELYVDLVGDVRRCVQEWLAQLPLF